MRSGCFRVVVSGLSQNRVEHAERFNKVLLPRTPLTQLLV